MSHRLTIVAVVSVLALAAAPALAQPVCYALGPPSDYTEGCLPPCLCPILVAQPLVGTFALEETTDQGTVIEYEMRDVRLRVDGPYAISRTFEGSGRYTRISGFAGWMHQLQLRLSVDGAAPVAFDSGLVNGGGEFPRIDIAIAQNGFFCYDIVLNIHAGPAACRCPCEVTGDGAVDVHDLLAYLRLWFAGEARADIDGTDGVTVHDLLAFLDCWFDAACA